MVAMLVSWRHRVKCLCAWNEHEWRRGLFREIPATMAGYVVHTFLGKAPPLTPPLAH